MRFINFLAPFIFGLVGILSFAPFSIKFLIFISYSYLIYILISDQKNDLFKIFIWGIGHWGFGMSWIIVSVYYYGETTIALTFLIYVLLVCILSIVFTCPIILIKKLLNLNCYISVSGIITFKKSEKLLEAVSEIPLDKLSMHLH